MFVRKVIIEIAKSSTDTPDTPETKTFTFVGTSWDVDCTLWPRDLQLMSAIDTARVAYSGTGPGKPKS